MKNEAEIWSLEVIYDDDFDYDIKILINWQLIEFVDVIILKTMKT